MRIYYDYTVCR